MKVFTKLLLSCSLLFSFLLISTQKSKACVDYHTTVFVTCHYDTTNFTDIAITVSNLRLFGGNQNDFCSCGITNYTNIFTNIQYVAFVDSGTTNPVAGFDVWNANANASNAWESVLATGDWQGFVTGVNGNGLTPTAPVELIIRASLPLGYTFSILDSNLTVSQIGTDEWSDTQQNLTASHQSISGFWSGTSYVAEQLGSTYFTDLDNSILVGNKPAMETAGFDLYPNPAIDQINLLVHDYHVLQPQIELLTATGQRLDFQPSFQGNLMNLDISDLPAGIYFVRMNTEIGLSTKKFVKTN